MVRDGSTGAGEGDASTDPSERDVSTATSERDPSTTASDRDAPTLLVAGTASHVGKSTVVTGLCRLLADRGVDVVPFKAQNMSNNARAVPASDGEGFGEIGVSQYVQARAARIDPTTDHNPVLLKPRGNAQSQLILDGEAVADYDAGEYYDDHWGRARETAEAAWRQLATDHDLVIAEGAGSIAEINLHDRDLANVELARFADAAILLVADIERGGAFASIVGTLSLLPDDVRERVVGVLITKFRGEKALLDPGIEAVEARTGVPVLGVLPHDDPGLPEEDSLALPGPDERAVRGCDPNSTDDCATVAVPRLPRISNFTDLEPLAEEPGLCVSYRPIDDEFGDADAVVLPGSKNIVDDLLALRDAGFDEKLRAFDGPIVGLCGGYQLLGRRITNAEIEGTDDELLPASPDDLAGESRTDDGVVVEGLDLLPVETRFFETKRVERTSLHLRGAGPLTGTEGPVSGYEIHMGRTHALESVATPFSRSPDTEGSAALGAAMGSVLGTYLHGLFENDGARDAFVESTIAAAGIEQPDSSRSEHDHRSPYDRAARLCAEGATLDRLFETVGFSDHFS